MSKWQLSSFWSSKVCLYVPVPLRILLSSKEEQSPHFISGQDWALGEGQRNRGGESGIVSLIRHSSIVKVSALRG